MQGKKLFYYDEGSLTTRSSVPNHNGNTSTTARGNLTRVRIYKDATNYVETKMEYDSVGNVIKTIDPLDHPTTV
jgi:hypothetical protein